MRIVGDILVGSYALLNVVLAVAGTLIAPEASWTVRIVPAILFLGAGACLGGGIWRESLALVLVGLVVGSVAPFLYGVLIEHSNVALHHAVRAVVAVIIGLVWSAGRG